MSSWGRSLGAWPEGQGTRFRVWAPAHDRLSVVLGKGADPRSLPMVREAAGYHTLRVDDARPGDLYRYRLPHGDFPDPASRFQPEGVHGPSAIVDPTSFAWSDEHWRGLPLEDLVIYELHVGTFTPEGTYAAAREKFPLLRDLGVTAVELLPLADFPGRWNWGYDGAALFAPARCYGRPDDLRALVNEAHRLGLAVFLDVVYNHLGPEGCYIPTYYPDIFSATHASPWGRGLNFDGPGSESVRELFIQNALHWIHEYHVDGLRLDATFAILDQSPRHFLAELSDRVSDSVNHRQVHLIAEDHRNLACLVRPRDQGGYGLSSQWADDFHHVLRVALAGDHESYFQDYVGTAAELALVYREGWLYHGQKSQRKGKPHGTPTTGLPFSAFVHCIQNHDQVGNRAFGDRLSHEISPEAYRVASALLLVTPGLPLLFMGQEWAASTPFQFFTDHPEPLGQAIREGRRKEFRQFRQFADPTTWDTIPDPQSPTTFEVSRLDWEERDAPPHKHVLALYRDLLALRGSEPALRNTQRESVRAVDATEGALVLRHDATLGPSILVAACWHVPTTIRLKAGDPILAGLDLPHFEIVLCTEDPAYTPRPQPPRVSLSAGGFSIEFTHAAALLLRLPRIDPGP